MGETLKRRIGFLPVWAWALLFVVVLGFYLRYRQNKAAMTANANQQQNNLSSNLGTVPVSNLTTAAQPMPIQMGDTFVSTSVSPSNSTTVNNQLPSQPPATIIQQPAPVPSPSPVVKAVAPTQTPAGPPQSYPGYGANLGDLLGLNPGLLSANSPGGQNIPGITGFKVSYNGVPL